MVETWQSILEGSGAHLEGGVVSHFGDPSGERRAAAEGAVVTPLIDRALIALGGEPAESFLQTQLTCDVREATHETSILGAYCNPKGRVVSVFRLFRWQERFVISVLADAAETTEKRLTLYRMRTPVTIERLTDVASIGLAGPEAPAAVSKAGLPVPEPGRIAAHNEVRGLVAQLPSAGVPRFEVHAPFDRLADAWKRLSNGAAPAGTPIWRLQAIRTGELDVPPALCESFTANMLNLYELGAVKFEKGCFPGQEVVARTHHLGKVPRRLMRARMRGHEAPAPGAKLRAHRGEQARDAGVVVEAAPAGEGRFELLAVVAAAQLDAEAITAGEAPDDRALSDLEPVDRLGV